MDVGKEPPQPQSRSQSRSQSHSQSQSPSQSQSQSQSITIPQALPTLNSTSDVEVIVVAPRNSSQHAITGGHINPGDELDWAHRPGANFPTCRRTPRACILCRKKKVRCDGNTPPCSQCRAHKSQCVYVPRKAGARNRRNSARSKATRQTPPESQTVSYDIQNQPSQPSPGNASNDGQNPSAQAAVDSYSMNHSDYLSGLSAPDTVDFASFWDDTSHVGVVNQDQAAHSDSSMDEILRSMAPPASATLIPQTNDSQMLLYQSWFSTDYVRESIGDQDDENDAEEDNYATEAEEVTCSLQIAEHGYFKYMGPSVSFFPGTSHGRDWITRVTGNKFFTKQMTEFLSIWKPEDLSLDLNSMQYDAIHLPNIADARIYVNGYFEGIQCLFPILDYGTFMQRFEATYKDFSAENDTVWWALLNVVLAIGCRAVASRSSNLEASEHRISSLFQNSLSHFLALVFGPPNLLRVQTFALMHVFSCFSSSPHIGYAVFSSAVRGAQAIGLHVTPCKSWGLSKHEIRQRKFVFWSLYCLDTDLAFRMGRPPLINRQDVKLQRPRSFDLLAVSDAGHCGFSVNSSYLLKLFNLNIDTSNLLIDAYEITNSKETFTELQEKVDQIDQQVSSIFDALPPAWRLKDIAGTPEFTNIPGLAMMSLARLYCSNLNAVWNLHFHLHMLRSLPDLSAPLQQPWQVEALPLELHMAAEAALSAASILQNLPPNDHACYWIFNPYLVFGFYIMFHAVLECPNVPRSEYYMGEMSSLIEHTVDGFFVHDALISDKHLTHFLTFFARTARMALRRAKDMKIKDRRTTTFRVGEGIEHIDLDECNDIDFIMGDSLPSDSIGFRHSLQV